MIIRSTMALRNGYDEMVRLAKEKREKGLDLLFILLQREQSRLAGAKISTMDEMERLTQEVLIEGNHCN